MSGTLINTLAFFLATLILISIHEGGHFYAARCCGVKVLEFSMGFGKVLWSFKDRHNTRFNLRLLPLGGYVDLLGERNLPMGVPQDLIPLSLAAQPLWKKVTIIGAGPMVNFIFAVFLYALVLASGVEKMAPVLGEISTSSPAYAAGFRSSQEIEAVNHRPVSDWEEVLTQVYRSKTQRVLFGVVEHSQHFEVAMPFPSLKGDFFKASGLSPWEPMDLSIGGIVPGSSAMEAGLKEGDEILEFNGKKLKTRTQLIEAVRSQAGQTITLKVKRSDQDETLRIKVFKIPLSQKGFLGVQFKKFQIPASYVRVHRYDGWGVVKKAWSKSVDVATLTVHLFEKMIKGSLSFKQLGGPISIAEQAGSSLQYGWIAFANFLAFLSVNIAVFNLIPIPILDGGRILLELLGAGLKLFDRDISQRVIDKALYVGLMIVIAISLLALYNDLSRL